SPAGATYVRPTAAPGSRPVPRAQASRADRLRLLLRLLARAFERPSGLGEEDVVQRRRVELEMGKFEPLGVERPDDVRERCLAAVKPDGGRLRRGLGRAAEALEQACEPLALGRVGGDDLAR